MWTYWSALMKACKWNHLLKENLHPSMVTTFDFLFLGPTYSLGSRNLRRDFRTLPSQMIFVIVENSRTAADILWDTNFPAPGTMFSPHLPSNRWVHTCLQTIDFIINHVLRNIFPNLVIVMYTQTFAWIYFLHSVSYSRTLFDTLWRSLLYANNNTKYYVLWPFIYYILLTSFGIIALLLLFCNSALKVL